ncbi:MAG: hypothetical protein Q9165_006303 [Trypethelium subeluteriae]
MITPQLHPSGNPAAFGFARRPLTSLYHPSTSTSLSKTQIASLTRRSHIIRQRSRTPKWLARHDAEVQFRLGVHPEVSYKTRRTNHIAKKNTINRQRRLSKWVQDFIEAPPTIGTRFCSSWNKNEKQRDKSDQDRQENVEDYGDSWHQESANVEKRWQAKMEAMKKRIELKTKIDEDPYHFLFPTARYATPLWGSKTGTYQSLAWRVGDDKIWENLQHHTNYVRSLVGLPPTPVRKSPSKTEGKEKGEQNEKPSNDLTDQANASRSAVGTSHPTAEMKRSSVDGKSSKQTASDYTSQRILAKDKGTKTSDSAIWSASSSLRDGDEGHAPPFTSGQGRTTSATGELFKSSVQSSRVETKYEYDPISNRMVAKTAVMSAGLQTPQNSEPHEVNAFDTKRVSKKAKDLKGVAEEPKEALSEHSRHAAWDKPNAKSQIKADTQSSPSQDFAQSKRNWSGDRSETSTYQHESMESHERALTVLRDFVKRWMPCIENAIQQKVSSLPTWEERGDIQFDLDVLQEKLSELHGTTPSLDRLINILDDTDFTGAEPKHLRQGLAELKAFFEQVQMKQTSSQRMKRNEARREEDIDTLLPEHVRAAMGQKKTDRPQTDSRQIPLNVEPQSTPIKHTLTKPSHPYARAAPLGPVWRRDEGLPRIQLQKPLESSISRLAAVRAEQARQSGTGSRHGSAPEQLASPKKHQLYRASPKGPVNSMETSSRKTTIIENLRAHERERERVRRKRWSSASSCSNAGVGNATAPKAKSMNVAAADRRLSEEVEATKAAMQAHEMAYHSREPRKSGSPEAAASSGEQRHPNEGICMQQGEGDMCADVVKFAGYDRWYKKPAPHALIAEEKNRAQKEGDLALARDIRRIYESHYGIIDTEHRQRPLPSPSATVASSHASLEGEAHNFSREDEPSSELLSTNIGDLYRAQPSNSQPEPRASPIASQAEDSSINYSVDNLSEPRSLKPFTNKKLDVPNQSSSPLSSNLPHGSESTIEQGLSSPSLGHPRSSVASVSAHAGSIPEPQKALPRASLASPRLPTQGLPGALPEDISDPLRLRKTKNSAAGSSTAATTPPGTPLPALNPASASPVDQPPSPPPPPTTSHNPTAASTTAIFKIIYSDPWTSTTETETLDHTSASSSAAASEHPIRLSLVLATLEEPLKFLPRLREYIRAGYDPVGVTKDIVILRRIVLGRAADDTTAVAAPTDQQQQQPQQQHQQLVDEGTAGSGRSSSSSSQLSINPIDGMSAVPRDAPPPTGNFASPTGFVNYGEEEGGGGAGGERPRVRREERVFSGRAPMGREKGRRRVLWTALLTASGCYVVGWLSELLR